ncbi:MAG: AmmeMemoRadiSam system protein B [Candidatus Omnitrophica bacterium]|nr:AmmeMemoRadiSam system protein B [Candidatus Omnitrophota bacterium]
MEKLNQRKPAVAGQFYPANAMDLNSEISGYLDPKSGKQDVLACIMPHAGYMYSGPVAGAVVSRINIPEHVVLLGPNHTGQGTPFSLSGNGSWKTPLGELDIDVELGEAILSGSQYLQEDSLAHLFEHSLEVELPFLQYFRKDFKIVPICVASLNPAALKSVGAAIADAVIKLNIRKSTLIVASSDMTHYEPQKEAEKKDKLAIDAILELNEDKLLERIAKFDISMCGVAPVAAMLVSAKKLGAKKAQLIKYQTSGDVSRDFSSVVGYAGIIIY